MARQNAYQGESDDQQFKSMVLPQVFSSGQELRRNLIDGDRTFQYISQCDSSFAQDLNQQFYSTPSHIGNISAFPQLESTQKASNYHNHQINSNNMQSPHENKEYATFTSNDPKWQRVMHYIRKNPKILMKMIPSPPQSDVGDNQDSPINIGNTGGIGAYYNAKKGINTWVTPGNNPPPHLHSKTPKIKASGPVFPASIKRKPVDEQQQLQQQQQQINKIANSNIYIQNNQNDERKDRLQTDYSLIVDTQSGLPPVQQQQEDIANLSFCYNYNKIIDDTSSSMQNQQKQAVRQIDWADTLMYKNFQEGIIDFNKEKDLGYYNQTDIEYILDMLRDKYRDFKRSQLMKPFYKKASLTLSKIMEEYGMQQQYHGLTLKHNEVNIENTLRFLIRARLLLKSRSKLIQIFALISKREELSQKLKKILKGEENDLDIRATADWEKILKINLNLKQITSMTMKEISQFQVQFKQFKGNFVFNQQDYFKVMRDDVVQIQQNIKQYESVDYQNQS